MTLPKRPEKAKRDTPMTFRLTRVTSEHLHVLAEEHNITMAEVIEHLIEMEYKKFSRKRKESRRET